MIVTVDEGDPATGQLDLAKLVVAVLLDLFNRSSQLGPFVIAIAEDVMPGPAGEDLHDLR